MNCSQKTSQIHIANIRDLKHSMEELFVESEKFKSLAFTLATGLWLYWLWTRRDWYRFAFRFPCYFGLPLLGIVNRIRQPKDILRVLTKLFAECKRNTFCAWMGMYLVMVTSDSDIIEHILSAPPELLEKSPIFTQPFYEGFRGGLFAITAKEWQIHRKLINPSFIQKVMLSFFPIFHNAKKQMLFKFDALVGTGEHSLKDMIMLMSLKIASATTMGKPMEKNDIKNAHDIKLVLYLSQAVVQQVLLNFVKLRWLYVFNPYFHKAKNIAYNFVNELIERKLQTLHEIEKNKEQAETAKTLEPDDSEWQIKKTPRIFIDQAIQLYQQQQFTWNDIISESNTIVAASFDTISTTLSSTFVMLAMHPEVQEKLYEEIVSVFPEKDFQMEYEHMEQLPYLDMVLNETMRLESPVPLIARQPVKDTQLTKDILLPKDIVIMISIFHLHRNTDIWGPNANKFNPDNFLPGNLEGKPSHAFIPFSKGARNCIGWRYAIYALKVLIAGCVRNFRYTTTFKFEDLDYVENVTLKYLVEPRIEIHRR